jgi:hypothetical protein
MTEATGNRSLQASPFIQSTIKLPLPTTVYSFRSKILQLPSQAKSGMALLYYKNLTFPKKVLMNLEKHEECRPVTSDSD